MFYLLERDHSSLVGNSWRLFGDMGIEAKLQKVRQGGGVKARARGGSAGSEGIEERAVAIQSRDTGFRMEAMAYSGA